MADITLFNARYDANTRTEVYVPTRIRGVSYYESEGISASDGVWTNRSIYKIRVPLIGSEIGKEYLPERKYRKAENADGYWTIRKGDFILLALLDTEKETYTSKEIAEISEKQGLKLITVTEYADNTVRGSDIVKHWRIGGA